MSKAITLDNIPVIKELVKATSTRPATIVVAASDSQGKIAADYTCTGTNDQYVINQAIQALPNGGGKILLLEGTYTVSESITVNKSNVSIEGMGHSTKINVSSWVGNTGTDVACISISNANNVSLCDFDIYAAGADIDGIDVSSALRTKIRRIGISSVDDYCINISNSSKCVIEDNDISSVSDGIHIASSPDCVIGKNNILNVEVNAAIQNDANSARTRITENYIDGCQRGINLNGSYSTVSLNTITNYTSQGIRTIKQYIKITDNTILSGAAESTASIDLTSKSSYCIATGNITDKAVNNEGTDNTVANNVISA